MTDSKQPSSAPDNARQSTAFRKPEHFKIQTFSPQKFQQSKKGGFNPSTFKTQHKG